MARTKYLADTLDSLFIYPNGERKRERERDRQRQRQRDRQRKRQRENKW